MRRNLLIISLLILTVWSCAPTSNMNTVQNDYHEDLSAHRPSYPDTPVDTSKVIISQGDVVQVTPIHHITDTLNAVLDSISVLSQGIRYIDGYTVQIYSGNNREAANIASGRARTLLESDDSELKPKVSYSAPNFKVQVGKFYNTLDAHSVHARLLSNFPNAIIVLKKFRITRK